MEDADLAHLSPGERAGLKAGHGRMQNRAQHMRGWFLLEQLPDNKRELQNAHHGGVSAQAAEADSCFGSEDGLGQRLPIRAEHQKPEKNTQPQEWFF